ncbi:type II toxin-antitoxin system PemK/MazF family toxin [Staphylococcus hominis]|uniref:type II toxin-antitoxin system PemK/MazF family toxin n=1 Tax=Staphylococcus hominis TaxID=1290 RepID=UPI0011A46954|nr:type II toxin-antitoxin system PemK/MazF family toxin [Staphylococcus hominis]MCI3137693.1 type II toxin-antitoxin system PemK/MazF family toxin [Staphylococcus hominis subsp. hominis]MDS3897465.1 type II toxin-antitoxin system PemK/MazF family toxin [Staphylococcus hominis]
MDRKIYNAMKDFDFLSKTNNKKFKYLPSWQYSKAYWFKKEHNGSSKKKYVKLKRGSIVFVNFGVNVGSEISGHHFAVVVNKDDTIYKPVTTVVPLTSKSKDFYIPLENTVIKNATVHLRMQLNEISKKIEKVKKYIEILDNTSSKKVLKYRFTFSFFESINIYGITMENTKEIDLLEKVVKMYEKYQKKTYADVNNIQTISKLKIQSINKYDPSGKIKVSNNNLNDIDKAIIERFTL